MNRDELQRIANERIRDATVLLEGSQWSAAYYLVGYAIECALKSCILHHLNQTGVLFKDRKYLDRLGKCWTHDFDTLLDLAGLTTLQGRAQGASPTFRTFWGVVRDWSETSRYERKTELEARALYEAVTHETDGVMQWTRQHW